jgi:hypothetical protein
VSLAPLQLTHLLPATGLSLAVTLHPASAIPHPAAPLSNPIIARAIESNKLADGCI